MRIFVWKKLNIQLILETYHKRIYPINLDDLLWYKINTNEAQTNKNNTIIIHRHIYQISKQSKLNYFDTWFMNCRTNKNTKFRIHATEQFSPAKLSYQANTDGSAATANM